MRKILSFVFMFSLFTILFLVTVSADSLTYDFDYSFPTVTYVDSSGNSTGRYSIVNCPSAFSSGTGKCLYISGKENNKGQDDYIKIDVPNGCSNFSFDYYCFGNQSFSYNYGVVIDNKVYWVTPYNTTGLMGGSMGTKPIFYGNGTNFFYYNTIYLGNGNSDSTITVNSSNIGNVSAIVFKIWSTDSPVIYIDNIICNSYKPPTTTTITVPTETISPTTIPGQTVSVDSLVTDSFSLFSFFTSDYLFLILSFVAVFVVIDVVIILFLRVTK